MFTTLTTIARRLTMTTSDELGRALLDVADRGLTCDNEDVRLWTREWVEHYRDMIEAARDGR